MRRECVRSTLPLTEDVMNVVIWRVENVPGAVNLYQLDGLEKSFRLSKGVPLLDGFPSNVAFRMNPDFPQDRGLPDCIDNVKDALLVSERLHAFLSAAALPKVEFLPVAIVDPEGRPVSRTYVVVHPVEPVDCVDLEASVYGQSEIVAGKLQDVAKLVLDPSRVPLDRPLFRARGLTRAVFVERSFADAIRREGFSGVGWAEIEDFRS